MSHWDIPPGTSLEVLLAEWRGAMVTSVSSDTIAKMFRPHSTHIAAFFNDRPSEITKGRIADYCRMRLGKVHRNSVKKELSTLRGFLAWCVERDLLDMAPVVPNLPKKAIGVRAQVVRVNNVLTPDEARRTIRFLPEWGDSKRTGESFPVRARFELAYETALRPTTISRLVAGKHYVKGWDHLELSADIMKSRRDSTMPLNQRARAALDRVCPPEGPIFGRHDFRGLLEVAARKAVEAGALTPEKARTLSAYDFRHSRATEYAERSGNNLTGIQALLDHTDVKSTMRYLHPTQKAARAVLDDASGTPTRHHGGLVGVQDVTVFPVSGVTSAKTRGRTGTPSRGPEPEPGDSPNVLDRARELLDQSSASAPVAYYVLTDFARAVLSRTEIGRLALGVLEGGAYGHVRALELATLLVDEQARRRKDGER